jgi:hypothetical protein
MTNQSFLISNYVNHALIDAQIERSDNFDSQLNVVKLELKFDPEDGKKFKEVIGFIYSFLGYAPLTYEGGNSFLIFIHDSKIHSAVNTIKNMMMSLKIKYAVEIKNAGITTYDRGESKNDFMERVHKFFMKSKIIPDSDIYYGTKNFEYNQHNKAEGIQSVIEQEPVIAIHGFYKDVPLVSKVDVINMSYGKVTVKTTKEYLPFFKQQGHVWIEHSMIPDIMRAQILSVDPATQMIEIDSLTFIDDSPVHRKNARVTPHEDVDISLGFEDEFYLDGEMNDISIKSILVTTQLDKIKEVKDKGLQSKSFILKFNLIDDDHNATPIDVKAKIFKFIDDQIVLNIYPTPAIKKDINKYIDMCQNLLLLEMQENS